MDIKGTMGRNAVVIPTGYKSGDDTRRHGDVVTKNGVVFVCFQYAHGLGMLYDIENLQLCTNRYSDVMFSLNLPGPTWKDEGFKHLGRVYSLSLQK